MRLFQKRLIGAHAAVYGGVFENLPKPVPQIVGESLDGMPAIEAGMRELSGRLFAELPRQIARFREAFPKFRCGTAVYFLYSAGAFDGATRDVSGKEALMFGLDVIARLKEPLSPLFAHAIAPGASLSPGSSQSPGMAVLKERSANAATAPAEALAPTSMLWTGDADSG